MNFDFRKNKAYFGNRLGGSLPMCEGKAREILEGEAPFDRDLWCGMAELGWMGTVIPEEFGGIELSHEDLCVLAEEIGRSLAPTPFSSSVFISRRKPFSWPGPTINARITYHVCPPARRSAVSHLPKE